MDRAFSAYPLLLAYLVLLILYAWQTTNHTTPWLFTDELQWALLSRGVAHHGVPTLRYAHAGFGAGFLYDYVLAPAWWAHGTVRGYSAAKYINAVVMTASLFPGYALARLFVSRPLALVAGVATAAIPALVYVGLLIPESLAYFWSTLTCWLVARALVTPCRSRIAAAVIALALCPLVRSELTVLIAAAAVGALIVIATSARGRALVRGLAWPDRLGVVVLVVGGLIALGALGNHHSYSWEVGTHYHHRMFTYGLWAIGAFAIGVGVLPVAIALAWLLGNRFATIEDRALGGLAIGTIVALGLYTAVKASYISTNFAIRIEERDLIYLSPVVFAMLVRWLANGRTRILPLVLSVLAVGYLLATTPYENNGNFYSDAPGLTVLQWLNQKIAFTTTDAERLLFGVLAGTVIVMLLRELALRRGLLRRIAVPAGALLAALVIGWNLWGEIASANASNNFSKTIVALPSPPDWIDNTTGEQPAMFIGQGLAGSNDFWSLEFWNQSLQYIWSVDASAPLPGPRTTPNFLGLDGAVDPQLPIHWIVAAPGVDPVGRLVTTVDGLNLYRVPHPVRLADAYGGISTEGSHWMESSAWYYRFTSAGSEPGYATLTFSRTAACGSAPPSHITIRLSSIRITPEPDAQPVARKLLAVRHVTVRSTPCTTNLVVRIPARTPYRLDLTADRTFEANPAGGDLRQVSAQVTFGFQPRSP